MILDGVDFEGNVLTKEQNLSFNQEENNLIVQESGATNSTSGTPPKRKRKSTNLEDSINVIIESLNKPITVPDLLPKKEKDSIDLGLEYVSTLIRKIDDEKKRENIIYDIIKLVMERK